jgi:hypothetical protein
MMRIVFFFSYAYSELFGESLLWNLFSLVSGLGGLGRMKDKYLYV